MLFEIYSQKYYIKYVTIKKKLKDKYQLLHFTKFAITRLHVGGKIATVFFS